MAHNLKNNLQAFFYASLSLLHIDIQFAFIPLQVFGLEGKKQEKVKLTISLFHIN